MHRFGSVILVDARGWILLQERDEHPAIDPDKWGLAGGHLEGDEPFDAGAVRELEEETGVRLGTDEVTLFRELEIVHEAYGTLDVVAVYAARTDLTDEQVECHEGRQIVFVEPTRARALDLTASASIVVPDFLDSDLYQELTR